MTSLNPAPTNRDKLQRESIYIGNCKKVILIGKSPAPTQGIQGLTDPEVMPMDFKRKKPNILPLMLKGELEGVLSCLSTHVEPSG